LNAQWVQVNNGLPNNLSVTALATSGTNLFAGTWGAGVFLSTDNGTSWTQVNNGLTDFHVYAFAVSGTNFFAGTESGVFLSTNNGTNWSPVNTGLTNTNVIALAASGTNLFAGTGVGVFLSTNNGTSWTQVNTGLTYTAIEALTVSGTNLFAGTGGGGVFKSNDNGTNWTPVNNGLTNPNVLAFVVSGTNLFAGTIGGVFLSTDNGASWSPINNGLTNQQVQALAVSGTNLFAGTNGNGGVFLSTNNGTSWTQVNTGLTNTYIRSLAISGTNVFAGTNGGVFRRSLQGCVQPPSGMVAWWPLDETSGTTAHDIAGYPNNGTCVNCPTPVSGKVSGALSFNGNNSVDVADHPELNFAKGNFSIDLWIKTNDTNPYIRTILDKRTGSLTNMTGYELYLYEHRIGLELADGTLTNYNSSSQSSPIIADNNWHHIAVTVDRANTSGLCFYVDGSLVATFNPTDRQGDLTNTAPFVIGRNLISSQVSQSFIGTLDEIELFNRVLSPDEIKGIYNADSCGKCKPATAQICVCKFNDLNGNGVQDPGEGPLSNWVFNVTGPNNYSNTITTDEKGCGCLTVPAPGTYTVTEVMQSGWTPTTTNPQTITVTPGQTYNLIFGNRQDTCVTAPKGMLNWWPLDETSGTTAYDIAHYSNPSSFDNNGTWVNNPTPVPGKVDGALSFSGNNYVQVPNHSELNFGIYNFSIDAWVWTKAATGRRTIIDKREKWDLNVLGYEVFIENGILSLQLADGSFTDYHSSQFIADGNWHHIAITIMRNNSIGLVFYVDGNIVTKLNPTNHPGNLDNKAPLLIGGNLFDPDYHFIGIIDEVEMFGFVLPQQDIVNIYNAGSLGKCKPAITSIGEFKVISSEFKLLQCYPNPFNPSTNIEFYLPKAEFVKLSIFDILGREIAVLVDENVQAGKHRVTFDAINLPAGVYFYRMQAGKFQETRKIILLK
jgi:hypothetical protein